MVTFTGALQDTAVAGRARLPWVQNYTASAPGEEANVLHDHRPPVEPNAGVGNADGPGHFTQLDSITQLASSADANLYAYAADNPTNNIDSVDTD